MTQVTLREKPRRGSLYKTMARFVPQGVTKTLALGCATGFACASFGATVKVANVTELENALANTTAATIQLTNTALRVYQLNGTLAPQAKVTLLGATENPEDIVIRGNGSANIMTFSSAGNTIRNLTFENGYASDYSGVFKGNKSNLGLVSNCVFRSNSAPYGAVEYCSKTGFNFTDCVFSNNTTTGSGGGVLYRVGKLTHCLFADNSATSANSALAGAVYEASSLIDCTFTNNTSALKGGAVYLSMTSTVSGCTFVDNRAATAGSAIYVSDSSASRGGIFVTNCTFRANGPLTEGDALNGTVYALPNGRDLRFYDNTAKNGGAAYESVLSCCTFSNNTATANGGAAAESVLTNCTFWGNTAVYGGAAYNSTLLSCLSEGNAATTAGGAVYGCAMFCCTNRANINTMSTTTKNYYGSEVSGGSATDCLFERFGNESRTAFNDGVYDRCRFIGCTNGNLFSESFHLTNCLIAACETQAGLFRMVNADASIVNTTIVSNRYRFFGNGTRGKMVIENTFFYGNRTAKNFSDDFDFDSSAASYVSAFNHCIFATTNATVCAPGTDNLNYYGNASFRPGFVGAQKSPADPFALTLQSPAVKKAGAVYAWMADATDIRGEGYPRLRDGGVNIGCYQCWLVPAGLTIKFK